MEAYPFLRSNLEALEKTNPSVHRWLKGQLSSLGPSEKLVRNAKGLLDWRLPTGRGLWGPLLPWMVYKDWRVPEAAESGVSIVVGSNLGYGLNHLLPKAPRGHQVLVLEPRAELLLACLGFTDYRPFLEARKLLFLAPDLEQVRNTLSTLVLPCLFGKIFLKTDVPSLQLGPEYALWAERCKEVLEDLRINVRTIRLKQDQMILNEMQNLKRASHEPSPAALRGRAGGITGVVLGAGPSLEQFAPVLAPCRDQALFATSFQALPALRRLGLTPHFAMVIDSSPYLLEVYKKLDRAWVSQIPLIYSTLVHPDVIREYPGPTIPIWTTTGLACHFRNDREPLLDVGGNVGVALFRFLRWCGVDKMVMAGQDFSWTGARSHVEGHFAAGSDFHLDPKTHIQAENRYGRVVYTTRPFLTSLGELERDLEKKDIPVFDLYGGGLPIRGSEAIGEEDLAGGILPENCAGKVGSFMRILSGGLSPAKPFWAGRGSGWRDFFKSAKRTLGALLEKTSLERPKVVAFLDDLLRYLQGDPLRKPYLMNEVINLAGLIYKTREFSRPELEQCREIILKAEVKLETMDHYFACEPRQPGPAVCAGA